ncbi:MAG: transporter substrate-binding domain-containing protein, partial [Syntrophales bacterium]|nr:transporter substrate-binding domain-containing protein [Syntrophales bacterium]
AMPVDTAWSGRNPTFVIASQSNAPPFSFLGKDGEPEGILIEFWRLWAARNGYRITFHLEDLDKTIEAVRRGKADFHAGLFSSASRSVYFDFSSGFLDDTLSLFVLDKLNVQTVAELAATAVNIGVSRDHYAAEHLQARYPELRLRLFPSSEEAVKAALRGEVVAFAVDYPIAFYFLSRHDARGRYRIVTDLATYPLRAAVRKGDHETLHMIEEGLRTISPRDMEQLADKWGLRDKGWVPPWFWKAAMAGAALLLIIVFAGNWVYLRREVRRKTHELHEKNRILSLINRDIQEATQTVQNQMETLEKLSRDKDELMRIVTQDLKEPIHTIHKMTEGGNNNQEVEIHRRTARLLTLIDRLQEVSRLEAESYRQDMELVNLAEFLASKKAEFRELGAMKNIHIQWSLPHQPVPVLIHVVHFTEIIRQLFLNAVKFSEPGREVSIVLRRDDGAEDGPRAVLEFHDQGIGIPQELLPHIFEGRGTAAREGTQGEPSLGMGLSVVKRLLDLHRGRISVDSEEGRGSTFIIALPLREDVTVDYEEASLRFQTGDIVLFKGLTLDRDQQPRPSENWTHTGIIVKMPGHEEDLLWESTPLENIPDRILGYRKGGPQLVSLRERLLTYETDVYAWRPLRVARSPEMIRALFRYIYEFHRLPFPRQIEVIRRVIQTRFFLRWWPRKPLYGNIFCSELVAESYIRMGLLPETPPPSSYLPLDFSEARQLPLLKGASFGREILLRIQGRKERFILPASLVRRET